MPWHTHGHDHKHAHGDKQHEHFHFHTHEHDDGYDHNGNVDHAHELDHTHEHSGQHAVEFDEPIHPHLENVEVEPEYETKEVMDEVNNVLGINVKDESKITDKFGTSN